MCDNCSMVYMTYIKGCNTCKDERFHIFIDGCTQCLHCGTKEKDEPVRAFEIYPETKKITSFRHDTLCELERVENEMLAIKSSLFDAEKRKTLLVNILLHLEMQREEKVKEPQCKLKCSFCFLEGAMYPNGDTVTTYQCISCKEQVCSVFESCNRCEKDDTKFLLHRGGWKQCTSCGDIRK